MKRACIIAVALLLAGCQNLDTTYAERDPGSVNGISVFAEIIQRRLDPAQRFRLGGGGRDLVTMIHVVEGHAPLDAEAVDHIDGWLRERSGRQFLLVLRDGDVAGWLLTRWIDQAEEAEARADDQTRSRLQRQRELWRRRRAEEFQPSPLSVGTRWSFEGWDVVGRAPSQPAELDGISPGPAPPMMRLRSTIEGDDVSALVTADDRVWLAEIERDGSRLVVATSATPLLDAALVDPAARRLAVALVDAIAGWDGAATGAASWVHSLRVREGDPVPPSVLRQLFATPPFSYVAFHLLALLLLYAWLRAAWLGRTNPGISDGVERFDRHVSALAWRLGGHGAWRQCLSALARYCGHETPSDVRTEEQARRRAAELLGRTAPGGDRREDASP